MHYLIDGYNLLFRLGSAVEEFTASREAIIKELNRLKLDITVVFDAPDRPGVSTRTHYHNLEILYSGEGELADDLIIKVLKRLKGCGNFTVVTSDKRLAWRARLLGAKTESVDSFMARLNKRSIKKNPKPIDPLKKIKPKEEEQAPSVPEESIDYYLSIFEKEVPQEEPKERKKIVENDFERWFRIFEERLKGNGA